MRVRPTRSARSQKAHHLIAALVPALIVTLSITGFVWAQKEVTVVVDGRTLHMKTQAASIAGLLEEAGIAVDAADLVTPSLDSPLDSTTTVLVRHSVPVTLDLGGSRMQLDVVGESVADALVAAGTDPAANPGVTPALDAPLRPGMTIHVPDVFVRVTQQEATVAAPVRYEKDPSLAKGTKQVITKGRPGKVMRVYRVLVTNGVEGTATLSAVKTVAKPVSRVVAVGTASKRTGLMSAMCLKGRGGSAKPPVGGRRMRVEATGYSAKEPGLGPTTATGAPAVRGVIAVDPLVIPLRSRVYIPGYGYAIASDTGGAIKGARIDLCFDTVAECNQWGRRPVTIIILD